MNVLKKIVTYVLISALVVTNFYVGRYAETVEAASITNQSFLKANGKVLKNNYGNGDTVYLRGTNAGGYMLQEFWMCPTNYSNNVSCQLDILNVLTNRFGADGARTLVNAYEANYWKESDFDECAKLGMNCIRLPLWYRNFVDANGNWYSNAFDRVDWFVEQAGKRGMYVVIDMHGAYGSQNGSDHSGVDGGDNKVGASEFFFGGNAGSNQEKYYAMWEKLAAHFKGNPTVAGYDLLNEPYSTYRYNSGYSDDQLHQWLWNVYNNAYRRIRAIDPDHVIIMEATWDAWDLPNPASYGWENVMYEYHQYVYDDYDNAQNQQITGMQNKINGIINANYNVPSYMGEFSYFNQLGTWDTGLKLLNDAGISWTTWSYKCVAEYGNWGIMNQNVDKVNVEGDSYDDILRKWSNVGSSYENTGLASTIKKYTTAAGPSNPGSSSLEDGKYFIVGVNSEGQNKIVCADDGGNNPLIANRDTYSGSWETLYVVNNGDGTISLRSDANGKYVCAVVDENCQLLARSDSISTWEKFYPEHIKDNQYALRAVANNKYVKADFGDTSNNGQLKATSDSVGGAWECFYFSRLDAPEQPTQPPVTTQPPTAPQPQTTAPPQPTAGGQVIEVIGAAIQGVTGNVVTFVWGQNDEQINAKYKYNVYIDNKLYRTYDGATAVEYAFDKAGEHTITIKALYNGVESAGAVLSVKTEGGAVAPTVEPTTPKPTTTQPPTTTSPQPTAGGQIIEVIGAGVQGVSGNVVTFVWGQEKEQIDAGYKYNVYIDNKFYQIYDVATAVEYAFEKAGKHTITIKAFYNGVESAGAVLSVTTESGAQTPTTPETTTPEQTTKEPTTEMGSDIVVSDSIRIEGFQISQTNWGLRTVSSVEPQINGKKVIEFGNVYAIKLGNVTENDMVIGNSNPNVKEYKATEEGITKSRFSDSATAINYVRTMTDNGTTKAAYTQEYMIRGYAKLADGSYVYSKVSSYSIFKVAKVLYENNMMSTYRAHDYIYHNILKIVNSNYQEVDYNWSNIVVKP